MPGNDDMPPTTRQTPKGVELGETIAGKYLVESVLGTGAMGRVLRARHVELDQAVAIKVMHGELLVVPGAARRFAFEARATASLRSQHAVRVYDIDRLPSGAPFIVMELLDGIDLGTMVHTRGPLPLDRVLAYMLEATEVIAEAHGRGIIHRDVKPRNMFLTSAGIIKVLDFGLAKALRSAEAVPGSSRKGSVIGSPSYMPPEQLFATEEVDERSDIWALGATLYNLLVGEPPFGGANLDDLASSIATHEVPRVTARRPDVTPLVDEIVARCMRKVRDERYPSVAMLQRALLEVKAAGAPLYIPPPGPDATRRDVSDLDERTLVSMDDDAPVPTRRR